MQQKLNQYQEDSFSIKFLLKVISIFCIALIAIYIICLGLYQEMTGVLDRVNYYNDEIDLALENLRNYEAEQLNTYGYLDKDKGLIRIPIEQAFAEIVNKKKY